MAVGGGERGNGLDELVDRRALRLGRVCEVVEAGLKLADGERCFIIDRRQRAAAGGVCWRRAAAGGWVGARGARDYGVCYAVVGTALSVESTCRFYTDALEALRLLVYFLPLRPRFVGGLKVFPFLGGAGELLRLHHRGRLDGKNGRVRDQIALVDAERDAPGVLEQVDILGVTLRIEVVVTHLDLEGEGVDGMRAETKASEMLKEIPRVDLYVEGLCVTQLAHPGVLDLGEDEGAGATLGCNVEALIFDLHLPKGFAFGTDKIHRGVGNLRVVRGEAVGPVEGNVVLRKVLCVAVKESGEVLFPPVCRIVENIEEDGINDLKQFVEVGVGRLVNVAAKASEASAKRMAMSSGVIVGG